MPALSGHFLRALLTVFFAVAALTPARAQNDAASRREAIERMYPVMIGALEAKNFGRARNICDQVILWEPQNPVHHYNLACIEAQAGGSRLPYAMGALELAIALGFDDVDHLKTDPDLAPLRSDPKFQDVIRKTMHNASADAAISAITIPEPPPAPRAPSAPSAVFEKPAPAVSQDGVPVGLYFMTRYWSDTRTSEKTAWYFAPDGTTYQNLTAGFSQADLVAHVGPKGLATARGDTLVVTWTDGKKSEAGIERESRGFTWDQGIFSAVAGFADEGELAGLYDGSEFVPAGEQPTGPKRLQLNADGTFAWSGISITGATAPSGRLSAEADGIANGRWQLSGYSLILTTEKGGVFRGLVFPRRRRINRGETRLAVFWRDDVKTSSVNPESGPEAEILRPSPRTTRLTDTLPSHWPLAVKNRQPQRPHRISRASII